MIAQPGKEFNSLEADERGNTISIGGREKIKFLKLNLKNEIKDVKTEGKIVVTKINSHW